MRQTKISTRIIDVFQNSPFPLSANDLLKLVKANKTTIYRQIDKLIKQGTLTEVDFADGFKRFEVRKEKHHHHHMICINCKSVKDVEVNENFATPKDFTVLRHSLEFFGLCARCQ